MRTAYSIKGIIYVTIKQYPWFNHKKPWVLFYNQLSVNILFKKLFIQKYNPNRERTIPKIKQKVSPALKRRLFHS